jgi:hypothetical protein
LGIGKNMFIRPLISSNTLSGGSVDNTGGRPTNESKGEQLTESGQQTSETDQNLNR